jgi:hypothetical protein
VEIVHEARCPVFRGVAPGRQKSPAAPGHEIGKPIVFPVTRVAVEFFGFRLVRDFWSLRTEPEWIDHQSPHWRNVGWSSRRSFCTRPSTQAKASSCETRGGFGLLRSISAALRRSCTADVAFRAKRPLRLDAAGALPHRCQAALRPSRRCNLTAMRLLSKKVW